jgi:hypothetical protein
MQACPRRWGISISGQSLIRLAINGGSFSERQNFQRAFFKKMLDTSRFPKNDEESALAKNSSVSSRAPAGCISVHRYQNYVQGKRPKRLTWSPFI